MLPDTHANTLRGTTFGTHEPSTILADFQTLIEQVADTHFTITGEHQLPRPVLEPLNRRMAHPLDHNFRRPHPKSMPHINGLYLLLRASGLCYVNETGKTPALLLDEAVYQSWQALTPTERYFALLETWLLRASPTIIGESEYSHDQHNNQYQGWTCWQRFAAQQPSGFQPLADETLTRTLSRKIGLYNLALMELFGIVTITAVSPLPSDGWNIANVAPTAFGTALHALLAPIPNVAYEASAPIAPEPAALGTLRPLLQPYFPAYQQALVQPCPPVVHGFFTFTIATSDAEPQRIQLPATATLADLSDALHDTFHLNGDHLYQFVYPNRAGTQTRVYDPDSADGPRANEVALGQLPLRVGTSFVYYHDLSEWYRFDIMVERVDVEDGG